MSTINGSTKPICSPSASNCLSIAAVALSSLALFFSLSPRHPLETPLTKAASELSKPSAVVTYRSAAIPTPVVVLPTITVVADDPVDLPVRFIFSAVNGSLSLPVVTVNDKGMPKIKNVPGETPCYLISADRSNDTKVRRVGSDPEFGELLELVEAPPNHPDMACEIGTRFFIRTDNWDQARALWRAEEDYLSRSRLRTERMLKAAREIEAAAPAE